jgi:Family of unknown function (DUF6338)
MRKPPVPWSGGLPGVVLTRGAAGSAASVRPRARRGTASWGNLFSDRPNLYVRVETTDGTPLGGRFADNSYAGGFPHDPDLYLEGERELDDEGRLVRGLGYPV